jgi:hypothetical protein
MLLELEASLYLCVLFAPPTAADAVPQDASACSGHIHSCADESMLL